MWFIFYYIANTINRAFWCGRFELWVGHVGDCHVGVYAMILPWLVKRSFLNDLEYYWFGKIIVLRQLLIFFDLSPNSITDNVVQMHLFRETLSYISISCRVYIIYNIMSVTLSILTSAAPLSVALSLFSKRKVGEKRAQRRSWLKGLQRLFYRIYYICYTVYSILLSRSSCYLYSLGYTV